MEARYNYNFANNHCKRQNHNNKTFIMRKFHEMFKCANQQNYEKKNKWIKKWKINIFFSSSITLIIPRTWVRTLFFADSASVHTYLVNPAYESTSFGIHSRLECKFLLNTLWIRNRVDESNDERKATPVLNIPWIFCRASFYHFFSSWAYFKSYNVGGCKPSCFPWQTADKF